MYELGDKVVYPNHGVGVIRDVKEFEVGGEKMRFFEVYITASKSTVKVPANNAVMVGLRKLLSKEEIENVFAYLRTVDVLEYEDWKERFKFNSDLMRTGKIDDMAKVLKNLHFVSTRKPLSFREKRMYERSLNLIASEIAEVRKSPVGEVEDMLQNSLNVASDEAGVGAEEE